MEHLGGPRSKSVVRGEVNDFIDQQKQYGFTLWVLELRENGQFLGFCGLDQLDYLDEPETYDPRCTVKNELELGFRIRADYWKLDYATEGGEAALGLAFGPLNAERVVARAARDNVGSRKTLVKLGMRHNFALDYWADETTQNCVYTVNWRDWADRH